MPIDRLNEKLSTLTRHYTGLLPESNYPYYHALIPEGREGLHSSALPLLDQNQTGDEHLDWLLETQTLAESIPLADLEVKTQLSTFLKTLRERQQQPGFRLAIVGEFSRGKSCLINRLLERDELLPVSAAPTKAILTTIVAGSEDQMKVSFDQDCQEVRSLSPSAWQDLLITDDNSDEEEILAVCITLNEPWLRSLDVELIDTPGAGDLNQHRAAVVFDLISQCDAAVLVVSATQPFSLTEATFLEQEVIGRHVPRILVVVSKLDTIALPERESILATIRARVAKVSPAIPVLPSYPINDYTTETEVLSKLKTEIAALVAKGERRFWRSRQVAGQLTDCLSQICQIGESAIAAARMSSSQWERAVRQAQTDLRQAELEWENLLLELERRRIKRDRFLQQRIMQAKTQLLEVLKIELNQVPQPKIWWERDLPLRLRRALITVGRESEEFLISAITEDFEWLQTKISRVFATGGGGKSAPSWEKLEITPELAQLELSNPDRERTLARIGSSAAAVCGYVLGGPVGIILSASVWLVGEHMIDRKLETQRQLLAGELGRSVNSAFENYCNCVCDRLRQLYNTLAEDTHNQQLAWQSAKNAAVGSSNNETDRKWHQIIEQATALNQKISAAVNISGNS